MTVTTSVNKIIATGDAIQVDFPYDFIVLAESHMNVYLDGVLEDTANWSMTGLGVQAGGVVTMTTAPGSGVKVTLLRIVPNTQLVDYSAYGSFPAETHERALDLRVMEAQQAAEEVSRSVRFPVDVAPEFDATFPEPIAGRAWKITADGLAVEHTDVDMDTIIPLTTAQAVIATDQAAIATAKATASQLSAWEAEAEALTADSYATEAEDVFVNIVTSDGDGTFTYTPTTSYSALHWATKALSDLDPYMVSSIADLRLVLPSTSENVILTGYYAAGDGGGGSFYWDAASTEADNAGTIIKVTAVVTGRWKRTETQGITPGMFGAVGDGTTDDKTALQNWAALGGLLTGTSGKTYLTSAEIPLVSDSIIDLNGAAVKAITRIRSLFYAGPSVADVYIANGIFDLGQSVLPTYTATDYSDALYVASAFNSGVYAFQAGNINITKCTFTNLYTNACLFYQCSGFVEITNNKFISPAQIQGVKAEHLFFQTCDVDLNVKDNLFDNAIPSSADFGVPSVFTSGMTGTLDVSGNTFKYSGRNSTGGHQLAVYSSYGDVAQGKIYNNKMLNCLQQCIRLTICHHMDVHHNYVTMSALAGATDQMVSIEGTINLGTAPFGCDDIKIHHNTFIEGTSATRDGIFVGAYDWGYPCKDIFIDKNVFIGIKYIVKVSGPFDRVFIKDNTASGANGNIITYNYTTVVPTATHGTQVNSNARDLVIEGNVITGEGTSLANPIYLYFTGYTGNLDNIVVRGNNILNNVAVATSAMVFRGIAAKGNLIVENNTIKNYSTVFDIATGKLLTLRNNVCQDVVGAPVSLIAFTSISKSGNRYSDEDSTGVTRLSSSGGTITVTTAEILTGDNVQLTRVATDGSTLGHLTLGAIVDKTSFVIDSTSATESSFILWDILH